MILRSVFLRQICNAATTAQEISGGRNPEKPDVKLASLRQYTTSIPIIAHGSIEPSRSIIFGTLFSPPKTINGKKRINAVTRAIIATESQT